MPYPEEQLRSDYARVLDAMDEVAQIQRKYKDVIVIPEVITLHDIAEYRLATYRGHKPFKEVYDKKTAEHVLNYFSQRDLLTQEAFEDAIVLALHTQQPN